MPGSDGPVLPLAFWPTRAVDTPPEEQLVLAAAGTGHGAVGRRVGFPAQVAATAVNDAVGRTQVQVDVAVRAAGTPEEPGRVLSLGEAKWGETLLVGLDRLYA
ncbi:MAG: hypothetical protein ACRDNS_35485 [Trebonia sp.]